ncbi:MAG: DUF4126 domain-containing protein [Chloroflexi bacterium]|nr:DUF4126 domain-containing protein [Chloroflexota bacterium]MBU1751078.1 DUF4126 domain-containing protein [Chloroflexota bacterium]
MLGALTGIASAFGLSTAAGLNAYVPLLVVALLARFTDLIVLEEPYNLLANEWVIILLLFLLTIEFFADKVPAADSINDVIQTVVRPVAGAILFAATSNVVSDIHPVLALVCGLLVAGGVHATKATVRPVITATTAGTMNPVVSLAEDVGSLVIALLAVLVPVLFVVVASIVGLVILWLVFRRQRRSNAPLGA